MADSEERVRINFQTNAGQVAGQVNNLGNSLDDVTDSATDTSRSMHNLDASFDEVYGDIKPLTAQLGELEDRLYQLALSGQQATDEFAALTAEAARLRVAQQQVDRQIDASSQTIGQKLGAATQIAAAGISAVTSGMALLGADSEDTEKALLKVQAAMAFADSISSLADLKEQFGVFKDLVVSGYQRILAARQAEIAATTQATIAQRLLNLTALANPYVLLGAAIAAVGVVTYAWVKSSIEQASVLKVATDAVNQNKEETDLLAESIKNSTENLDTYNNLEALRAKALGASDDEIRKLITSQKELALVQAKLDRTAALNNAMKAENAAVQAFKTNNEALIEEAKENSKKALELLDITSKNLSETRIALAENGYQNQIDIMEREKSAAEKALEEKKKRLEDEHKYEQDLIRLRGEMARAAYEKEIKDFEDFKSKLIDAKIQSNFDEHERVTESLNQITEEEDARLLADAEQKKKIDEYKLEQKRVIEEKQFQIAESAVSLAGVLAGKSKGLQKAAIIGESAVGIGRTVQGVFTGNAAALAQGIAQAGPIAGPALATPAIVLNSVQGALSVAGNIAATSKALQALGGGSAPSATTGGTSAGSAAPAVQFNNTAENQIGQATAKAQAEQAPIKVVVSESDITKAQNNVNVLVETNTF